MVSNSDARSRGPNQPSSSMTPGTSAASKAAQRVQEEVESGKRRAESRIDSMAQSMHDAVDLFHDENEQLLARCMDYAAGRLESVAQYLKDRSFRGLRDDAADVVRSHSLAFMGLALVSGFAAGRFLRSSTPRQSSGSSYERDDQDVELPFATYGPGSTQPRPAAPPLSAAPQNLPGSPSTSPSTGESYTYGGQP